jgi:hypothetical protein
MTDQTMWFGSQQYMQWVACPAVGSSFSRRKWSTTSEYLNGGAYTRSSVTDHRDYQLTWGQMSRAEARKITDYASGIHGSGLIYFADPFAMDSNMLPSSWAFPGLGGLDGPILDGTYVRPTLTPTSANGNGYPSQSAVYNISGTPSYKTWIPIPPGYTLHVGAHGSASGGLIRMTPTTGVGVEGTTVSLTLLAESSTTRVNYSLSSAVANGAYIRLGGTGQIILSGVIAQLLPTGNTPELGGYISGQGNSGCRFEGFPEEDHYSAALDRVAVSAKLREVGAWL